MLSWTTMAECSRLRELQREAATARRHTQTLARVRRCERRAVQSGALSGPIDSVFTGGAGIKLAIEASFEYRRPAAHESAVLAAWIDPLRAVRLAAFLHAPARSATGSLSRLQQAPIRARTVRRARAEVRQESAGWVGGRHGVGRDRGVFAPAPPAGHSGWVFTPQFPGGGRAQPQRHGSDTTTTSRLAVTAGA